jgi:hypothetical protein
MKINTFRKEWLPEELALAARETASGGQTFTLIWNYREFPRPVVKRLVDVPLSEIRADVIEAARYMRKAQQKRVFLQWHQAFSAVWRVQEMDWSGVVFANFNWTPEQERENRAIRLENRLFWREAGLDVGADGYVDMPAIMETWKNGDLTFDD